MKTRLLIIVVTFVLFSSLFTINEAGALIVGYSLEDLAEKAEFVVIGEVTNISPPVPWYLLYFTDGYDRFHFDVTLSVEDDLDGTYGKDTILFRIHDSREEFGDNIEDEQNFEIGERVLVFIGKKESNSVGDAHFVTGVTQGKYLLKDGIAFGTHFPQGISEEELILKIKNIRLSGNIVDDEPLVPEPGPICSAGTIVKNDACVIASTDCGEGTTYQNGMCVVDEIENSTKSSSDKWGEFANPEFTDEQICGPGTELIDDVCIVVETNESKLLEYSSNCGNGIACPDLTPTRDYDYGLIYMTILLIMGIIGGIVGGIIFVIRRKRK